MERLFRKGVDRRAVWNNDGVIESGQTGVGSEYSLEYQQAPENDAILKMIEKVKSGDYKQNETVDLGVVDDIVAQKIQQITGINVKGWQVKIEARQIYHILKDHGKLGKTDQSMANDTDIAKMEYVLDSAENIEHGGTTRAYTNFLNGKDRLAQTVVYEKDVGGIYYYVVEAVPDTSKRTLFIVSAYMNAKKRAGGSQPTYAQRPSETSENETATYPANTTVPQNGTGVNSYSMQDGGENSQFSFGDSEIGVDNPSTTDAVFAGQQPLFLAWFSIVYEM